MSSFNRPGSVLARSTRRRRSIQPPASSARRRALDAIVVGRPARRSPAAASELGRRRGHLPVARPRCGTCRDRGRRRRFRRIGGRTPRCGSIALRWRRSIAASRMLLDGRSSGATAPLRRIRRLLAAGSRGLVGPPDSGWADRPGRADGLHRERGRVTARPRTGRAASSASAIRRLDRFVLGQNLRACWNGACILTVQAGVTRTFGEARWHRANTPRIRCHVGASCARSRSCALSWRPGGARAELKPSFRGRVQVGGR